MTSNVYEWIRKEENRRKILMSMKQPLTAKQICKQTGIPVDTCSYVVGKFVARGLAGCLNPDARNSRLYWVTDLGQRYQKRLQPGPTSACKDCSGVNWDVYGWVCYSHRATIIRVLTQPMQPSEIKRAIRKRTADMKISANNIRDVVKLLLEKGIVQKVFVRKKAHPQYELTESGKQFQELLMQSEMTF